MNIRGETSVSDPIYYISPTQPVNQSCTSNLNPRSKMSYVFSCVFLYRHTLEESGPHLQQK